jgi:anti-sigma B factor antagonist
VGGTRVALGYRVSHEMSSLDLRSEIHDQRAHVVLRGELDIATSPRLEEELESVEASLPGLILVDLRAVDFIDSTGLRTLLGADARAREGGRRLAIVRGPKAVDRVFEVTKLDDRLEIVDDPQAVDA